MLENEKEKHYIYHIKEEFVKNMKCANFQKELTKFLNF